MEPDAPLLRVRPATLLLALAAAGTGACHESSSSDAPPPPESSKVRITSPTSAPSISVGQDSIDLGGSASIDAWSYAREVEPNVRLIDETTGASGEASEHCDWVWFFGYFPTNHTWSATVPLASGANAIRVEAYYSTSGTVVGSDSVLVHAP